MYPFSYLGNGWTDCAEIWYRGTLNTLLHYYYTIYYSKMQGVLQKSMMLHCCTCARLFLISGTPGRIALKFWCVIMGPTAMRFNDEWSTLHVRTCAPLFHISATAGRFALKIWFVIRHASSSFTQVREYLHELTSILHPFKNIYLFGPAR